MVGIMISIIPDGMAVDKMEETEEGNTCPLPTQDEDLNAENREMAIEDHNYREKTRDLRIILTKFVERVVHTIRQMKC